MKTWFETFEPLERQSTSDIEAVVHTSEWLIYSVSTLAAAFLFIMAGNRFRQGDSFGATLSAIGALIASLAPIIAKQFLFGG